jgi:hypothetical protein
MDSLNFQNLFSDRERLLIPHTELIIFDSNIRIQLTSSTQKSRQKTKTK